MPIKVVDFSYYYIVELNAIPQREGGLGRTTHFSMLLRILKLTAHFWYDARNRVVARSYQAADAEQPTLTLNSYDDWNLIEERDETGEQKARYVHGPRIDEIVVMENEHGVFYPQHDALGSVTMLTDKEGKPVERYRYSAQRLKTLPSATAGCTPAANGCLKLAYTTTETVSTRQG